MNITVEDFCNLCCNAGDATLHIFDNNKCEVVYRGVVEDAQYTQFATYEVDSFDIEDNVLCLNISI